MSVIPITLFESREALGLPLQNLTLQMLQLAMLWQYLPVCMSVVKMLQDQGPLFGVTERVSFVNAKFAFSLQIVRISH